MQTEALRVTVVVVQQQLIVVEVDVLPPFNEHDVHFELLEG